MSASRLAPMRILFSVAAFLFLLAACAVATQDAKPLAGAASVVACTDVGVALRMRRTAAMPLEELSELHTGKTCVMTTIMTTLADDAALTLDQAALDVVDCVTTRIDEELIGLFAVLRVCNRPHGTDAATMTLATWDAHIRPKLQLLFGASTGAADGLQYHRSHVECTHRSMPASYTRRVTTAAKDDSDDAPRFRYKSTDLWSERAKSTTDLSSRVVLKLNLKNDGSAPLHVFAAAVKMADGMPAHGVLVLSPENVEAVMPSKEASVIFQLEMASPVEFPADAECLVYFAHTSSRAHILEGHLDGKKLKITSDMKKKKSHAKAQTDLLSVHKVDGTNSVEAAYYASFPYGIWQLASVAIVVVVGLSTTLYMRRKWARVHWSQTLDCLASKKLKHKSSSLSKTTEMTSQHPTYDPDGSSDADMDALESDGFLPVSSMEVSGLPPKKSMAKLREKMPAITMQWKKPDIFRKKLTVRRTLKLDGTARLDAKRFETLWDQFTQRHNVSFQATKRPTVEAVVKAMAKVGIPCMASGTVDGVEKYVLYAKQSDANDFFFVAVDILVASSETTLSIRASNDTNDSLIEQFVALVDAQVSVLLK